METRYIYDLNANTVRMIGDSGRDGIILGIGSSGLDGVLEVRDDSDRRASVTATAIDLRDLQGVFITGFDASGFTFADGSKITSGANIGDVTQAELDAAIAAEVADRDAAITAADTAVRADFATADTLIRSDFAAADAQLQAGIDSNATAITNEATTRATADTTLQGNIDTVSATVGDIRTDVDANTASVTANTSAIASNDADIASLNTSVGGLQTTVGTNTQNIANNTAGIATNAGSIAALDSSVTTDVLTARTSLDVANIMNAAGSDVTMCKACRLLIDRTEVTDGKLNLTDAVTGIRSTIDIGSVYMERVDQIENKASDSNYEGTTLLDNNTGDRAVYKRGEIKIESGNPQSPTGRDNVFAVDSATGIVIVGDLNRDGRLDIVSSTGRTEQTSGTLIYKDTQGTTLASYRADGAKVGATGIEFADGSTITTATTIGDVTQAELDAAIAIETTARQTEDAAIRQEYADADTLVRADFATADTLIRSDFAAADAQLQTGIDSNATAITNEATTRATADTTLQGNIDTVSATVGDIRTDVDANTVAIAGHDTIITGHTTDIANLQAADLAFDSRISTVETDKISRTETIASGSLEGTYASPTVRTDAITDREIDSTGAFNFGSVTVSDGAGTSMSLEPGQMVGATAQGFNSRYGADGIDLDDGNGNTTSIDGFMSLETRDNAKATFRSDRYTYDAFDQNSGAYVTRYEYDPLGNMVRFTDAAGLTTEYSETGIKFPDGTRPTTAATIGSTVDSSEIEDGAIITAKIEDGAVTAAKVDATTVTTRDQ